MKLAIGSLMPEDTFEIRSAVKSILIKIERGSGLMTEHLKEKDDALVYEIDQVQTENRSLVTILQNYVTDMNMR